MTTPVPQPEVEHFRRRSEPHLVDVGVPVADELRVLAAELQTLDETLQGRLILLVDELHRVASGHLRSLAGIAKPERIRAGSAPRTISVDGEHGRCGSRPVAGDIMVSELGGDADDHQD